MQLKTADHKYTIVMEPICAREDITILPNDRHMISMYSQLYNDTNVPGILQLPTPIQRQILKELYNLQELEKINPQDDPTPRKQFLNSPNN